MVGISPLEPEAGRELAGQGHVLDEAVLAGRLERLLVGAEGLVLTARDARQLREGQPLGGAEVLRAVARPLRQLLVVPLELLERGAPLLGAQAPKQAASVSARKRWRSSSWMWPSEAQASAAALSPASRASA